MIVFKTYSVERVIKYSLYAYFIFNVFLILLSFYGFFSGAGILAVCAGLFLQIMSTSLSLNPIFQRSPFALLFCFFTLFTINIPTTFMLFLGNKYVFGDSIGGPPFPQVEYLKSLHLAFISLSLFWFTTWLAIVLVRPRENIKNFSRFNQVKPQVIFLLGIITLIVTWINNLEIMNVMLKGVTKTNSLLSYLFFDHAFLVLAGMILICVLNRTNIKSTERRRITFLSFLIYFFFTLVSFRAGSKAAVLVVFILFFLYPISLFKASSGGKVVFPSVKVFLFILFLAPVLFYLAFIQRMSLSLGIEPSWSTLLNGLSLFSFSTLIEMVIRIFYRLSTGGLEQYILIFNSFVMHSFDGDTALGFFTYIVKNTINLILPGTIFPDAYAPSSQIFPQVLLKEIVTWTGGVDVVALVKSFNTQPYTLFGIFIVIFGLLSPIVNFLFIFIFVSLYNRINVTVLKIAMLYLFSGLMSAYGFEVVIGNTFNFLISAMFIIFLATNFSRAYKRTIN